MLSNGAKKIAEKNNAWTSEDMPGQIYANMIIKVSD